MIFADKPSAADRFQKELDDVSEMEPDEQREESLVRLRAINHFTQVTAESTERIRKMVSLFFWLAVIPLCIWAIILIGGLASI